MLTEKTVDAFIDPAFPCQIGGKNHLASPCFEGWDVNKLTTVCCWLSPFIACMMLGVDRPPTRRKTQQPVSCATSMNMTGSPLTFRLSTMSPSRWPKVFLPRTSAGWVTMESPEIGFEIYSFFLKRCFNTFESSNNVISSSSFQSRFKKGEHGILPSGKSPFSRSCLTQLSKDYLWSRTCPSIQRMNAEYWWTIWGAAAAALRLVNGRAVFT